MNRYIDNLKAFLAEQTPKFPYCDANSVLDMLYFYYTDSNPIDSAAIRCQFSELDNVLSKLSFEDCDRVFLLAVGLCLSHAKLAFTEGVQVGMCLFTELQPDNSDASTEDGSSS